MHWLEPEVTVAPTFDPVALDLAKAAQTIETDQDNTLLTGYLQAAVAHVEGVTGLRLARQTVKLRTWGFEPVWFPLPIAPVAAVTEIHYLDTVGASQTLDPALYTTALHGLSPLIARAPGQKWPATRCAPGAVTITADVGYAAGELPPVLRQAVLLLFGDFNVNRERSAPGIVSAIAAVALDALLANWRLNA